MQISAPSTDMGADISTVGGRLREERERLELSQTDFGEIAGTKKRTVIDWEKGVSSPTAMQLAALAQRGVDVLYVLTTLRAEVHQKLGAISIASAVLRQTGAPPEVAEQLQPVLASLAQGHPLGVEEAGLLEQYRLCTPEARDLLQNMAFQLATPGREKLEASLSRKKQ